MKPYYQAEGITLYHGDAREIAPRLGIVVDAAVIDPPYNETSLEWDVWPVGWPAMLLPITKQFWCFGSLRMFIERAGEFTDWRLAQDIVWEKHNGSGSAADRFKRVHELAAHFYCGSWAELYKKPPVITIDEDRRRSNFRRGKKPKHWREIKEGSYDYDGQRFMRSVIPVKSCHGYAVNETQKPEGIVAPLLEYSVPPGGVVLDLFAGSGTALVEARRQGKRAIGIETRLDQCIEIVKRLAQSELSLAQNL